MKVVICINKSAGLVIQRQQCLLAHACAQKSHLGTGGQMPVLKEYFSQILGEKTSTKLFPSQCHCADKECSKEVVYLAGEGMQTCCAGFGWDRVNFVPSSRCEALFGICGRSSEGDSDAPAAAEQRLRSAEPFSAPGEGAAGARGAGRGHSRDS